MSKNNKKNKKKYTGHIINEDLLKNLYWFGKPVTEKTFQEPNFIESLEYQIKHSFSPKLVVKYPTVEHIKALYTEKEKLKVKENPLSRFSNLPAPTSEIIFREFGKLNNTKSSLDNHFSDALKYSLLPPLSPPTEFVKWFQEGPTVTIKEESIPVIMKCFYKLYHGDKFIIEGFSEHDIETTSNLLMDCISKGKHLLVRDEKNEVVAFYNKSTVSELSFSIYKVTNEAN